MDTLLEAAKKKNPVWEFNITDNFGGKLECIYEYRPALAAMLQTWDGFPAPSPEVVAIYARAAGIHLDEETDQISERFIDSRLVWGILVLWFFKQQIKPKLKEALLELADEVVALALVEQERRHECEIVEGSAALVNGIIGVSSKRRKERLNVVDRGRHSTFKSKRGYEGALEVAKRELRQRKKPVTQEAIAEVFSERYERCRECNARMIREWNNEFGVNWQQFKRS